MKRLKTRIEEALPSLVPARAPERLREAMVYSLTAGGKRFRPLLVLAAAAACGADPDPLVEAACAVEFIHTYSLIHDDLPAMDNDSLRRGKPTSHVVFGEALAILAGDALNTEAFRILSIHPASIAPERRLKAVEILARASGAEGMAGGQVLDMEGDGEKDGEGELLAIHTGKTARLIQASVQMGALYGGAGEESSATLSDFGLRLGLMFQLTDDILDETSTAVAMGKSPGKDREQNKVTGPRLYGLERACGEARRMEGFCRGALRTFGDAAHPLEELVDVVVSQLPP